MSWAPDTAEFRAALDTATTELLRGELAAAEACLDAVLAIHKNHVHANGCDSGHGPCWVTDVCESCAEDYPCPTVRAAKGEAS